MKDSWFVLTGMTLYCFALIKLLRQDQPYWGWYLLAAAGIFCALVIPVT